MKVTLSYIAKQIGVSTATISRVLANDKHVKPETKALIENALMQYNYKHTPRRKAMPHEISNIILIITGDITSKVYASHIEGITQVAEKSGKNVLIANTDYIPDKEEKYLEFASNNGFAGVIMLNAIETPSLIRTLKSLRCPVVMVNRFLCTFDTDTVSIDNFRAGFIATDYLIKHGHKKIAHLAGPKNSITCQERLRGYRNAMRLANLQYSDEDIYYGDLQYDSGFHFGKQVAQMESGARYTAAYCANDLMASGLVDALTESGLSVPDDFSITCSDNTANAVKGKVKLTTVDHNPVEMGVSAIKLLLSRLENPDKPIEKITYVPVLTERNSVKALGGYPAPVEQITTVD